MLTILAQSLPESDVDPSELMSHGVTARDWIAAAAILVAGTILALIVLRVVVRRIAGRSHRRAHLARLIGRFAAMAIFLTGLIYALSNVGVRIGPLLGALGIVGIAIAFALQDVLKNLVAGIILQASSPFKPGDQVNLGEWSGTIEDIDFRSVVVRTFDNTCVTLPSVLVAEQAIRNLTAFPHRATTVEVGVAYGTDLRRAESVIVEAVRAVEGVEVSPPAAARLTAFDDSAITFAVFFWHSSVNANMWLVRHRVILALDDALAAAGITIPFPQRTVWRGEGSDASPAIPPPPEGPAS